MTAQQRSLQRWVVYIIACADRSLYTGITTDMSRRMEEHAAGSGAKYTKRRGPFALRYTERHATRSAALKREAAIKAMDRSAKLALIATVSTGS
jgi:putative endonuclease